MSAELLDRIRAGWKDTENVLKENRRMIAELSQSVKGLDKTKSASVRVQIKEGKKRLAEMTKHHRAEKKELNELVRRHTTERRMIKRAMKEVSERREPTVPFPTLPFQRSGVRPPFETDCDAASYER